MAKRTRGMTWMRVLGQNDLDHLKKLLTASSPKRQEWEYKLRGGNIIIYVPIIPWKPDTRIPDPSMRYMAKHLRVVPQPGGPFQLEYMRHTGQWWPFIDAVGDIEVIARHIEEDPSGYCGVYDSLDETTPDQLSSKRQPSNRATTGKRIAKKTRRKK